MVAGKPRKPPSHSDFTKSKSSLKAKQRSVPTNSTNTSFKARSIVLPNQSSITDLEARRATKLTDERGRGVVELVTVLRGVGQNAGATSSKSEALDSLEQLLPRLPDQTTTTLSLLPVVLPLITSSAANVRQSLHRFVVASLASLPAEALPPYATTMTLWLTSGMNHIWKEVREDSARLAEAVIDVVGGEMVKGWQLGSSAAGQSSSRGEGESSNSSNNGQRLFTSLLTSLGVTHGGSSNNNGAGPSPSASTPSVNIQSDLSTSPLSKMRLLRCLDKLVSCQSGLAVASQGTTSSEFPLWIFRSCFTSSADWEAFVSIAEQNEEVGQRQAGSSFSSSSSAVVPFTVGTALTERSSATGSAPLCDIEGSAGKVWGDGEILAALRTAANYSGDSSSSSSSAPSNPYLSLYFYLHPLLLSTFLDQAPAALGPDAPSSSSSRGGEAVPLGLRLIDSVLSLARTLGRAALRSSSSTSRDDVSRVSSADKAAITHLCALLDRASLYFPFEQRASQGGLVDERTATLRRLSAAWCELVGVCRMVLGPGATEGTAAAGGSSGGGDAKGKRKRKADISAAAHLSAVEEYLVSLLETKSAAATAAAQDLTSIGATPLNQQQQGRLSEDEYLALLPTVWHLICHSPDSGSSAALLQTTITHWSTTPSSTSSLHSLGLHFLLSLTLLASQPPHSLSPALRSLLQRPSAEVRVTLRDGFLAPPKGGSGGLGRALYELAARPGREGELFGALRCVLEVVRSHSPLLDAGAGEDDVEARLAASLCPLFWVPAVLRKGGVVVRKEAKGPYSRAAQRLGGAREEMDGVARALAGYLEDEDGGLMGAMRRAGVLEEVEETREEGDVDVVMKE